MVYVYITILILFAAGYIISLKVSEKWEITIDKKEHKLYFLYPMAELIMSKTGLDKRLYRRDKVTDSIKALYVTSKPATIQKLYWCSKISLAIAILFLFLVLALMGQLQAYSNSKILEGKYLMRPGYGEGSDEIELNVTMNQAEQEEGAYNKEISYSEDIKVQVKEQSYSEGELAKAFEEAKRYLDIEVLGSNEAADSIYEDLIFRDMIPGTSIAVDWKPEDPNLIRRDGTVNNDNLGPSGVITTVGAILSYGEEHTDYRQQFRIMPKQFSEGELLNKKLVEEIEAASDRTDVKDRLELPEAIENYQLKWTEKGHKTGTTILFMGVLVTILVCFYGDKELDQKMKKRKEQLLLDYPEIINKFTLLVNAGMTVKQAWEKIADDYEKKTLERKQKKRYAYEEMLVTLRELKLGIPENNAYEQFGRRVSLLPYIKFSSLIAQNLKKGSKGLSEILNKEATEAFGERKEIVKRLGEEAGTKLLVPMMIMLLIVFTIILIPAFLSFGF